MLLEGSLQRFELAHVLQLLAHTKATGVFEVCNFKDHGFIYLVTGRIEGISLPYTDLKLGTRLLQAGFLTEHQLTEALAEDPGLTRQDKNGILTGQRLIDKGFTSEATVREAVRRQASDWLFELVQWRSGVFIYDEPEEMPDFRVQIQAELKDLLVEAAQRLAGNKRSGVAASSGERELCAVCPAAADCSAEIRARYLKPDVCLWRSMSGFADSNGLPVRDMHDFYGPLGQGGPTGLDPSLHW